MNNWIEIDEAALAANYRTLQTAAGPATEVLAVVKANAYGHGAERCALTLVHAGARWLGVTCVSEGVRVRKALGQNETRILLMCGFEASDLPLLHRLRLTPVVWTTQQLEWLAAAPLPIHVEVDTGMNRQGARPGPELAELLAAAFRAELPVEGILTHFASSEESASALTLAQQHRFAGAVAEALQAGVRPAFVHAGASSAVDNPVQPPAWLSSLAAEAGAHPMVRTGIALYGHTLPTESPQLRPALLPVLTWKAHVLSVRELAVGDAIGYNATFTAVGPMRVALLPVGFADGLRRELSSTNHRPGGWVVLHGHPAPIVGRISMNLTVVDITGIPAAQPGDIATILGPGITADDHAKLANTTSYEILCGIHPCG